MWAEAEAICRAPIALVVLLLTILLLGACDENATRASLSVPEPEATAPLGEAQAAVSCDYDYDGSTAQRLNSVSTEEVARQVLRCSQEHLVKLYFTGVIGEAFQQLISRTAKEAAAHDVDVLILQINSPGGDPAAAMQAGNAMEEPGWGVWVKPGERCYSACVLVLAAARTRSAAPGTVGVHRLIPVVSEARTRNELATQLKAIRTEVAAFLEKQGTSPALGDLMMTVPATEIRILTEEEIQTYGLGTGNAAAEDLRQLQMANKCGQQFMARRRSALAEMQSICRPALLASRDKIAYVACMNKIIDAHGFPDPSCPEEGLHRIPE